MHLDLYKYKLHKKRKILKNLLSKKDKKQLTKK